MNQSLMPYRGNRTLLDALCLFLAALLVGCGRETTGLPEPAAGDAGENAEKQPEAASAPAPLKQPDAGQEPWHQDDCSWRCW